MLESGTVSQIIDKVPWLRYCVVISQTALATWVVCFNGAARLRAVKATRCEFFAPYTYISGNQHARRPDIIAVYLAWLISS